MSFSHRKSGSLNELPLPDHGTLILSSHPASLPGVSFEESLDLYRAMGASLVISLITANEMLELGLESLPDACASRGLLWWHHPISDMQPPSAEFDECWHEQGSNLHSLLDSGGTAVLHCWSGKGRTGTVAARILVERGVSVSEAMRLVRACRPGAIETEEQEHYVLGLQAKG